MPRIKDLTTKTGNLSSADQFVSDNGTAVTKIDYTALAKAIIEQYNGSTLAGSAQSVQTALNSLNSKSMTYTYAETSGSFLSWITSTFTANGSYYVVIATNNTEGLPIAGTGIALVQRRNADVYVQAFVNATGQPSYENRYIANRWTGWVQEPTRAEMDAVNSNLDGMKIITSSITANASKTFTVESNSRILAIVLTNQTAAIGAFGISVTSGGSVYRQKIGGGESIEISAVATNAVTFTHSATSGGGIVAFICFSGGVSET